MPEILNDDERQLVRDVLIGERYKWSNYMGYKIDENIINTLQITLNRSCKLLMEAMNVGHIRASDYWIRVEANGNNSMIIQFSTILIADLTDYGCTDLITESLV